MEVVGRRLLDELGRDLHEVLVFNEFVKVQERQVEWLCSLGWCRHIKIPS